MIRKIALTDREIESLPANCSVAAQRESLPDLFRKDSEWLEARWMPQLHDYAGGNRRITRVFLKPAHSPQDITAYLNGLPRDEHLTADLDGVALVTQLLVIDLKGQLLPTSLTTEVQFRFFEKTPDGAFKKTSTKLQKSAAGCSSPVIHRGGWLSRTKTLPPTWQSQGTITPSRLRNPILICRSRRSFAPGARLATEKTSLA